MPSEYTIPQILQIAKISQYLAANDRQAGLLLNSGSLVQQLPEILYTERTPFEYVYNLNPSDPNIRNVAEYILSLCGKYAQKALAIINGLTVGLPVLTGPVNQSVLVGQTATFSVSAAGIGPFSYAWFLNGIIIPGATASSYLVANAQLIQSGGLYSVAVTNAAGAVFSNTATLTVTAAITGYFAYMDTDPGPALVANNDPFTYPVSFNIVHDSSFVITMPSASTPNKFLVVKAPIGETVKDVWSNTPLNNGTIPDSVWESPLQFGGWTYYYTREAVSMDTTQTLIIFLSA